jgi:hypothetical protein
MIILRGDPDHIEHVRRFYRRGLLAWLYEDTIPSGILLIPEELNVVTHEEADAFARELLEAMTRPIDPDPGPNSHLM